MAQSNISIRMDDNLKKDFTIVCDNLGLNVSAMVTILAKKMVREQRIPFEVSVDPFYTEANIAALKQSMAEMKGGKTISKTMRELEAMENE
ncbi:MAG: type II toxin-antitoxin system RelB/DinJ family antitoxin [Clostridia bacterium]|nr:type II toxin-antitoxin system RelB/DinJ family antitoxin [Clostridia bacterium]